MYNNKTLIFTGSLSNYTLKDSNGEYNQLEINSNSI